MHDPHLDNSRVKIVLGYCKLSKVRSHIKFQNTRTFISSRNTFPGRVGWWVGGGWSGVNTNNHVKPNLRLRLSSVVVGLGF